MKKIICARRGKLLLLVVVLTITFSLTIVGCDNKVDNIEENINDVENTKGQIIKAKLTKMEENLIRAAAGINRYLVIDVIFDDKSYEDIEIWVDHYVKGELKGRIFQSNVNLENFDEEYLRIMLSTISISSESKEDKWILSTITESGHSAISKNLDKPKFEDMASVWGEVDNIPIEIDRAINIGVITLNSGDIGISSSIFTNDNRMNDHIQKYKEVYVLRCRIEG